MANYIKKYNVGNIAVDLPYNGYIHELPLLSFKDFRNAVNISLVFNYKLKIDGNNMFNIKTGFKLNVQKKIITNNGLPIKFIDANGKSVSLMRNKNSVNENSTNYNNLYTFDDESRRVLRILTDGYEIEYEDLSKDVYNSSGNIVATYDKYGDLYLLYTYNGDLLTLLSYNGKEVSFSYDNSRLSSIKYVSTTTALTYVGNSINLAHYSNVTYTISTSNTLYSVVGSGTENGENVSMSKECLYQNKNIILNSKMGDEVIDTLTYTFPDLVTNGYYAHNVINITNKKGAKQRVHYLGEKLLYTYELKDDYDAEFHVDETNDVYSTFLNHVNIYSTIDGSSFNSFNGKMKYSDGIQMSKDSVNENRFNYDASFCDPDNAEGYYLLTGWVKSTNNNKNIIMNISNHISGSECQFPFTMIEANKWYFFAYQFVLSNSNFIYLYTNNSDIMFRDVKICFQKTHEIDDNKETQILFKEDILIRNSTFDIIKLSDAEFQYTLTTGESGILKLTFSDLLRYFRKTSFDNGSNGKVLYYENGKKAIDNVQSLKVKLIETDEFINVNNFNLGNRYYSNKNEYFYEIRKVNNAEKVFRAYNYKNGVVESLEYLNKYFDLVESTKDGQTTHITRDKGLVLKEKIQDFYSISYNYDETRKKLVITKTDYNGTDEISRSSTYYFDSAWGAIYREEYGNNMECDNYYDSDNSTIVEHVFNEGYMPITHNYGYKKGNLASLSCHNLTYNFEYNNGDISKVLKCNSQIEEQNHDDLSSTVYYPSSASPVYSKKYNYDKYGRLTSIEGELVNTYDIISYFDSSTGNPTCYSSNSSSKLIMTEDKLKNQKSRYSYNNKDLIEKVEITSSNDYDNKISEETYGYDTLNRLNFKEFIYNKTSGEKVRDEISYVKNVSEVNVDERIQQNCFKINDQTISTTQNEYDSNKRLNKKTHTFNSGISLNYEYGIQYNKINSEKLKVNNTEINTTTYTYDLYDRILSISKGNKTTTYEYDLYNRLVRENNKELDKTIIYTYNNIGNILNVKKYNYSLDVVPSGTPTTKTYTYDTNQVDKLLSINNTNIPYNAIGCITQYNGYNLTWTKGKLTALSKGNLQTGSERYTYSYNAKGQRVSKNYSRMQGTSGLTTVTQGMITSSNKTYNYDSLGRLINEIGTTTYYQVGTYSENIEYIYDYNTIIGIKYTSKGSTNTYYFERNILGDVVGIYDSTGSLKVKYIYDAYGNCTISSETTDTSLAKVNPIRYRGYYYDVETQLFYCNSRYYSPELCRWISPDSIEYLDPQSINGLNLYAYCGNDPVNRFDPSGHAAISLLAGLIIGGLVSWGLSELFGEHLVTGTGLAITGGSAVVSGIMAMTLATPVGWIVGGITAVAGLCTLAFATAELQQHFTGDNWMLDGGMSQGAYYTLMTISSITASVGTAASSVAYHYKINTVTQKGRINGKMVSGADIDGYPGLRFSSKTGKVYSLEFHPKHNGHGVHIQWNQWFTTYPKFPGEYVLNPLWRLRLW